MSLSAFAQAPAEDMMCLLLTEEQLQDAGCCVSRNGSSSRMVGQFQLSTYCLDKTFRDLVEDEQSLSLYRTVRGEVA